MASEGNTERPTAGPTRSGPARRVTLHDVARAAEVSIATVSNVINGKTGMMGVETRDAVERAIRELGYRPNAMGRNLRSARRHSVGVICVGDNPSFLADPFNTNTIAGLSNVLSAHGYGVVVVGVAETALADSFLVRNDTTDALALIPSGTPHRRARMYEQLTGLRQPLIIFQDRFRPAGEDVLVIRQDDREGGRLLAARLIARGARRIAFLLPRRNWPAMEARLAGVRDAIAAASAPVRLSEIRCGNESMADTLAALDASAARRERPDAIMGGNDQMGIAALRWAADRGIAVPGEMKVTGFNAFEFRDYSTPTLTSIRSSAYAMGEACGRAVLARLDQGHFAQSELVFPVELVEGTSD